VKRPVRLLAIDIDGTLLDQQFQIPEHNLRALRQAHSAGIEVVLVTGRRHTFALPVAEALGFEVALISSNGAITKSSAGELFHRDLMPAQTARRLVGEMEEFRRAAVITFDISGKGELVLEDPAAFVGSIGRWIDKNAEYIAQVVPIEDALVRDPVQAMFCGSVAEMKRAQAALAASSVISDITVLRTQYDWRDLCIVDILNRGCSKGHALERWAASRGIARAQVMAIGDNYNDVEMLEWSGIPVVMGNASADLKQKGWHETKANTESGVAAAIEELIGL
jgi:Cof subfamily protein (haloacid dehalogenase superfamily)